MSRHANLRAVGKDEKPPGSTKLKTITAAASSGTERELLVAMRARLAKSVEDPNTPPRDLAALSRRLLEVDREIRAIDLAAEEEANENRVSPDEEFDASAV